MGAVRISTEFYTDQNVRYKVNIWDSDWASATITTFANNGFELEYDRCDKFLTPLIPSSCYFTLIDDNSAAFTAFKTDLANAQENEFKLYIEKYVSGAWVIDWAGIIMSDMVSWDNDGSPRYFEIVAKDGLNRLEGITFDKILTTPYTTQALQTVSKIIFDCLSYAGTAQFWNGSSKPYMACNLEKHDVLQTGINQAQILDLIYIGKEFLIDDSSKPLNGVTSYKFRGQYDKPLKTKDVLSQILQLFGLRIILSEGTWQILEVIQFTRTSDAFGQYNYLGSYTGSSAGTLKLTENGTTLAVLANGKYGYYPPVKNAMAKIYPNEILNGSFYLITGLYTGSATMTSSTFELGTIYGGTDLQLGVNIYYDVRSWNASNWHDTYLEITAKFVLGSNRVKETGTSFFKGEDAAWTTTAADKYTMIDVGYNHQKSENRILSFRTTDIPAGTHTNSTLVITATLKSRTGAALPTKADLNIFMNRIEVSCMDLAKSPPSYGQISELEYTNSNLTDNSINIDYGFLRINDNLGGVNISDFNSIMVIQPNNAGALTRSTDWEAGYTTDVGIVETLLKETVALQATAIKKYIGNFRSTIYDAWNTIEYDSIIWVFMGGRYSAKMDEWSGEWFAIAHDSSITIAATTRVDDYKPDTFTPTSWRKDIPFVDGYPIGHKPVIKVNTGVAISTATTSFTIDAAEYDHIRKGDTVKLIDQYSLANIQSWVVNANCEVSDTTLTVVSDTTDQQIYPNATFEHEPREYLVSNIVRATKQFQLGPSQNNEINQILKVITTDGTIQEATTDGATGIGSSNRIKIPLNSAVGLTITITAKEQGSDNCAMLIRQALISNNSGTVVLDGTVQTIGTDIDSASIVNTISITANNTNDCLSVEVDGIATNINWTVNVKGVVSIY
ncbi:MAG: hypothetical protein ACOYMA_06090 [Bacteroidia bacterium]